MTADKDLRAEQHKEAIRREWADPRTAVAWRKWDPHHRVAMRAATQAVVEAAQVRPGMHVLDVASGTGEPALTLAEAVAPGGRVTATDLVPEMLAIAKEEARKRGLDNIRFQEADAEALPFAEHTFDVVTCRFGAMYFSNLGQALREILRVLKPGGRAVFVALGPFDLNPYFTTTFGVFRKYVEVAPPELGAPEPFRFAQAGTLSAALREAGFAQAQEELRAIRWQFLGTPEQAWDYIRERGAPFRKLIEGLPPERREAVFAEVRAEIRRYSDGREVNFPFVTVLASGVRAEE